MKPVHDLMSDGFLHPNPHWYRQMGTVMFVPRRKPRPAGTPPPDWIPLSEVPPSPAYPVDVRFVGRSYWLSGDRTVMRHSSIYAIEYIVSGFFQVRTGRGEHVYGPGNVFILRPGISCTYCAVGRQPLIKYFCGLHVNTPLKRHVLESLGLLGATHVPVPSWERGAIEALFTRMLEAARTQGAESHLSMCVCAYELLVRLGKLVKQTEAPLPYPSPLVKALQFVHEEGLHVRVADMARAAGISVEHLNRLFCQHVGRRTHQWLLDLRMATAASLLASTRMKVHEIASELGYETAYSFSRAFRRVHQITPTECRRCLWRQRLVPQ
ncbi:MAG: AraC family transcriptional regulator [bacterium]|nr:AraC family transcriptional regulator [bacterium]